ncbi:MAG: hypothetical protein A2Z88_06680 [Omnitrophica WOR_2 bacterium GWA2_47_8]|nr:MAG: hypothetical protein A2Z88_06680 [Omnitrophica WOR_2 bacterium GWA2_47_8]
MSTYKSIISHFTSKRILVIGDLILDQHIKGNVSRISPEAPVPILLQEGHPTFSPGGAANVANNLRSVGAKVTLVGRIGNDMEGKIFTKSIKQRKIETDGVFIDKNMPTILKTRIMTQRQQVLRVDREKENGSIDPVLLKAINAFIEKNLSHFDAVIVSDYGKGMITPELLSHVCMLALKAKKVLTIDPKDDHFNFYRRVTSITPNKRETENAIRNIKLTLEGNKLKLNSDRLKSQDDVLRAGEQLLKYLDLESLLVTLGESGMCLFEKGKKPVHIPTRAQEVFDVTGAGDTVISLFTLALTAGATKLQAADIANHAAGIVVGKMGAATVSREELLKACLKGDKV